MPGKRIKSPLLSWIISIFRLSPRDRAVLSIYCLAAFPDAPSELKMMRVTDAS